MEMRCGSAGRSCEDLVRRGGKAHRSQGVSDGKRGRTEKRRAERAREKEAAKLAKDAERLFAIDPGGSPETPIVIESPAQVEVVASDKRCPIHGIPMRVVDHVAANVGGDRLRVAHVVCSRCDGAKARRRLFFQLASERLN